MEPWILPVAFAAVFAVVLIGVFKTKTRGFGRYTTSTLILVLVLFIAGFFALLGKLEAQGLLNILFAVAGYAGGLIVGQAPDAKQNDQGI